MGFDDYGVNGVELGNSKRERCKIDYEREIKRHKETLEEVEAMEKALKKFRRSSMYYRIAKCNSLAEVSGGLTYLKDDINFEIENLIKQQEKEK